MDKIDEAIVKLNKCLDLAIEANNKLMQASREVANQLAIMGNNSEMK